MKKLGGSYSTLNYKYFILIQNEFIYNFLYLYSQKGKKGVSYEKNNFLFKRSRSMKKLSFMRAVEL